jgi:hypothetical protein
MGTMVGYSGSPSRTIRMNASSVLVKLGNLNSRGNGSFRCETLDQMVKWPLDVGDISDTVIIDADYICRQ